MKNIFHLSNILLKKKKKAKQNKTKKKPSPTKIKNNDKYFRCIQMDFN